MPDCGAKNNAGLPCRMSAMPNGRCRVHGGMSPKGLDHPRFKHGRYSSYLPSRLTGKYEEAKADPDLISMREELALVDARISDVLQRVDTQECGTLWRKLGEAVADYRTAKEEYRDSAFENIAELVAAGIADYATWAEVLSLIEQRRKVAETETKRLEKMGQMITAERAMLLMSAVVDIIRRNVEDKPTLACISREIGKLVSIEDKREKK